MLQKHCTKVQLYIWIERWKGICSLKRLAVRIQHSFSSLIVLRDERQNLSRRHLDKVWNS